MLENGFEIIESFIEENHISSILDELSVLGMPSGTGGIRNADKKLKSVKYYLSSSSLTEYASSYLQSNASLVRAIIFNKTLSNNWLVPWHQDRTVAVSEKFKKMGWGPWSVKDGILHVQPPINVLHQMITFRIHLDDSDENNGCLRVLPKSQYLGLMSQQEIHSYTSESHPKLCGVKCGGAIVMNPLLLHSSSKSNSPNQRRIMHIEFSSYNLPNWY